MSRNIQTIPASKLKGAILIYKTATAIYVFKELSLRSISYNGQNLYAVQSEKEAAVVNLTNTYRLPVGAGIAAKIITANETTDIMCYLKDISMSGMAIISDFSLEQDTKIQISFRCDDSIQTVVGNIKQIYEFRSGKRFFYGCEFNEPNEVIGKYIMSKLEKKDNNVAAAAER